MQQHQSKTMVDTGLNSLYRLFNCCWYSWQGPRWIGRRGEASTDEGKNKDATGPVMEAAQVTGVQLCRPRELMPDSCAGHANHAATTSSSLSDHTIRYETLDEEHVEEVMQLLVHSFFREEPLGIAAGVRTPEDVRRWLPAFVRPVAREGVSTVAVEAESGRVVGVALCHVPHDQSGAGEHDSPLMAALDPARDGVMMAVAQFLADLHIGLQDEAGWLSLLVLNVERHFSGRGIAAELVRRSEERARNRGLSAVTADTTGEFSRKTFARLGYETLRELRYDEYAGAALRHGPVHTAARVMLKRLA
ncbi:hypothetical protein B566_EDAN015287 [Ephemera danica]|nr:hypothetical protein B566_EDAN015287 [Ephemera danica]